MKRLLSLGILLAGTSAFAAEVPAAAAIIQRYLKLPYPAEERLGEARIVRLRTLSELRTMPETAVREIGRALPEVKDPRHRAEMAEALRNFPTKESAVSLRALLADSDHGVRLQAIHSLRLLARCVDRTGGRRTQHGAVFAPKVEGLVPDLIQAANDPREENRVAALYALADTLDPGAVEAIRGRLNDESDHVRFHAACFLTEFQDASGLAELKQALERFRSGKTPKFTVELTREMLLASFERITGKSFGPVPMNPMLSSDLHQAEELRKRGQELLDAWAAWWAWKPTGR